MMPTPDTRQGIIPWSSDPRRSGGCFSAQVGTVGPAGRPRLWQVAVTEAAGVHDLDDRELVRLALAGQQAAAAELVRRYQDRVFNTCYRMCNNYADALDLTQSTFLKALENLGRFHGGAAFYTWVFRIAVNLTLSHRRRHSRRPHESLDGYREEGPVGNVSGREADPATAA